MLFNSYLYLFAFLPLVVTVFFLLSFAGRGVIQLAWLVVVSLVFYAWWRPEYLWILLLSIAFNYLWSGLLFRCGKSSLSWLVLSAGVFVNLALLGYFKYAGFFAELAGFDDGWAGASLALPLAISFFTFQQIAYLVDIYKGNMQREGFLRYCLFVTFFPQLIAGPIVHHREMMPQFRSERAFRFLPDNLAVGLAMLFIGLFKKVVLADSIAMQIDPVYQQVAAGQQISTPEAWLAALGFSLQVYFDFSGYSDMALGGARIFGINLPVNFYSPYKAGNITELWRRWHITLSRFIADYVFNPLSLRFTRLAIGFSGNRQLLFFSGTALPLMMAFFLMGLWHGAGWNFILFGVFHGILLVGHAAWQGLRRKKGWHFPYLAAVALTLFSWTVSVVLFRSGSLENALVIYRSMFSPVAATGKHELSLFFSLLFIYLIVLLLPNTDQLFKKFRPSPPSNIDGGQGYCLPVPAWSASTAWAFVSAVMFVVSLLFLAREVAFIYFQF